MGFLLQISAFVYETPDSKVSSIAPSADPVTPMTKEEEVTACRRLLMCN